MEKLEKIEKLRERAQVSYDEAREAYDHCNGDLLDALIYLEKQGKVKPPQGDGYYRSEQTVQGGTHEEQDSKDWSWEGKEERSNSSNGFKDALQQIWGFFSTLLQKGNSTSFEVLKDREHMASFPVTVLVLLLIFAPWITLPLIVIGLFFGFHYQFVSMDE